MVIPILLFIKEQVICLIRVRRFCPLDSVALLCSLGDYVGRVRHTTDADRKQISKIKHREEKVFEKLSKKEELRSAKLKYLKGEDETKLVSTAYDNLHSSLDTTRNDLDVAIQEEEEARKVWKNNAILRSRQFTNIWRCARACMTVGV